MKLFEGCLLVSDFDGTLADSTGKIGQRNREALTYYIENGGIFTVSTGRSQQGFHAYDKSMMNAPALLANGAELYDYIKGKTVFAETADERHIPILNRILEKFPDMCLELYNVYHQSYLIHADDNSRRHLNGQNIVYSEISSPDKAIFPVVKIMLGVGAENTLAVQEYLRNTDMGSLCFIPSYGQFLEILPQKAGKDKGMFRLAELYHIDKAHVFAVGDGSNDVDMLKAAYLSFAPVSGDEQARLTASVTVCSNDDGAVADSIAYLEKHLSH